MGNDKAVMVACPYETLSEGETTAIAGVIAVDFLTLEPKRIYETSINWGG